MTDKKTPVHETISFPLGDVLEFMSVIWAVDNGLRRRSKRMLARLGVTGPQRLIIRIVGRFPGITAGHLARILHMHPSSVTYLVKTLERRKLVSRTQDPRDGRRFALGLTAKGHDIDRDSEGTVEAAVEGLRGQATRHDLAAAGSVLSRLAALL